MNLRISSCRSAAGSTTGKVMVLQYTVEIGPGQILLSARGIAARDEIGAGLGQDGRESPPVCSRVGISSTSGAEPHQWRREEAKTDDKHRDRRAR
jgi:hypothetical protein